MAKKRYRISEAARISGIPEDTLRRYDKEGVLNVEYDRNGRLFSDADLKHAQRHRVKTVTPSGRAS